MNANQPTISFARLNPRHVRAKLGRSLAGIYDPIKPTGEYAFLHLINTGQIERAREILEDPTQMPDIGRDLLAFAARQLGSIDQEQDEDSKNYQVRVPKAVWHRYAKRAREEHRTIRAVLSEAVVAHDERIAEATKGQVSATRALQAVVKDVREVSARLTQQAEGDGGLAPAVSALSRAVGGLEQHLLRQGTGLAAMLMIMDRKGWIEDRLAGQLRRDKWL